MGWETGKVFVNRAGWRKNLLIEVGVESPNPFRSCSVDIPNPESDIIKKEEINDGGRGRPS